MTRSSRFFALLASISLLIQAVVAADEIEAGFVSIFDGKSLEGWEGDLKTFRVEDGAIACGSLYQPIPRNEFLCSKREYGDFELRLQGRIRGDGLNAGVQFRSQRIPNHHEMIGYQCDMGTREGGNRQMETLIWGFLYDESRRKKFLAEGNLDQLKKVVNLGYWNNLVIRCVGPKVEIWVNDVKTVDYVEPDDSIPRRGKLGLQIHSGPPAESYYRKIRIKSLSSDEASKTADAAPLPPERLMANPATPADLQMTFVGDVMVDDRPGKFIHAGNDPCQEFASVFSASDANIANLECVVATTGSPLKKPYVFRAAPATLPVLKKHFHAVSLANNHSGDFGRDAFVEMLGLLEREKFPYFGGGRNCAAARVPHIMTVNGLKIALLAYNDFKPRSFEAGPTWPGIAWCVDEQITADIRTARTEYQADLVIPFMHWGWENEPASDRQKQLARIMIDNGADLVVGCHPHVVQEVEYYQGRLIVYSLGNFIFDGFDEGPERIGWLLRLRLNRQGLVAWDTLVAHMDSDGIPHLKREAVSPAGIAGSEQMVLRRGLVDSPLTTLPARNSAAGKSP